MTDPRIDVRIASFDKDSATETDDGSIVVEVRLSRSIFERVTADGNYDIAQLVSMDGDLKVADAVKTEFAKTTLTGDDAIVLGNNVTADDILKIVKRVNNNPTISVAFGTDHTGDTPAGTDERFRIEDANKASDTQAGYVSGTLIFSQEGKVDIRLVLGDGTGDTVKIALKQWDSVASAKAAIEANLDANITATNGTTASDVIAAARACVYDPENQLTIAVKPTKPAEGETPAVEYFVLTPATVTGSGRIEVTLTVAKTSDTQTQPIEVTKQTLTIAQLPQTVEAAAVAAEAAIAGLTVDNDITQPAITTAITAVVGCTVSVTEFNKTNATTEAAGKVSFKVTLTNKSVPADYVVITKELPIAQLTPAAN